MQSDRYQTRYDFLGHIAEFDTNSKGMDKYYRSVYKACLTNDGRNPEVVVRVDMTLDQSKNSGGTGSSLQPEQVSFVENGERKPWTTGGHPFPPLYASVWLDKYFLLHAGCVGNDQGAAVFVASPGSGKTTLTIALVRRGLKFYSDDITFINLDNVHVEAFPRSAGVHPETIKMFPELEPFAESEPGIFDENGEIVHYVNLLDVYKNQTERNATVRNVFFLQRKEEEPLQVKDVSRAASVFGLINNAVAYRGKDLGLISEALTKLVSGANCYQLTYGDVNEAAATVASLM